MIKITGTFVRSTEILSITDGRRHRYLRSDDIYGSLLSFANLYYPTVPDNRITFTVYYE